MKPPVQGVSCEVCNKQRAAGEIHPKPSKILKGTTLLICKRCEAGGKEPRAFIIIAARTRGIDAVKDYIVNNKYEGKTIEAPEIIK